MRHFVFQVLYSKSQQYCLTHFLQYRCIALCILMGKCKNSLLHHGDHHLSRFLILPQSDGPAGFQGMKPRQKQHPLLIGFFKIKICHVQLQKRCSNPLFFI